MRKRGSQHIFMSRTHSEGKNNNPATIFSNILKIFNLSICSSKIFLVHPDVARAVEIKHAKTVFSVAVVGC